jgi:hypothetical protein
MKSKDGTKLVDYKELISNDQDTSDFQWLGWLTPSMILPPAYSSEPNKWNQDLHAYGKSDVIKRPNSQENKSYLKVHHTRPETKPYWHL